MSHINLKDSEQLIKEDKTEELFSARRIRQKKKTRGFLRAQKKRRRRRELVPDGSLIVAMDLGQDHHCVWMMNMEKMPLEDMEICNSPSGMDQLLERVHTLQREHHFEKVIFSMEPTDHYWMNVATYLENRELSYVLVQPLSVKRERQSTYYRYAKNDYRDAELNGNLVADRKFTFTRLPKDGLWASLRVLAQTYVRNTLQMSADQMRVHSFLRRLYPDYPSVFKDVTKLTALSCLLSMRCLPDITSDDYLGEVRQHFKRRILPSKVLSFHKLVSDTQSDWNALLYQDGLHICIAQAAERYRLLQRQQEELEQQLLALYEQTGYAVYANTIPHLAPVFHGAVLGLTGDPALYDASRCFTKFAGVDVKDNQSGNFQGETPITHAGNGLVRYLTYLSGFILKTHEPVFKKRYQYLTEGKRPPLKKNQALIALGCKYLRILWTLCTEGVCYEERKAEKGTKKVE